MSQTSRALNGRQDVSEETKRRVSQTAAAMGYVKISRHRHCLRRRRCSWRPGSVSRRRIPPFSLVLCFETYCRQRGAGGMILMNAVIMMVLSVFARANRASFVSGLLDFCSYVAAGLSSVFSGLVIQLGLGWNSVFLVWMALTVMGIGALGLSGFRHPLF